MSSSDETSDGWYVVPTRRKKKSIIKKTPPSSVTGSEDENGWMNIVHKKDKKAKTETQTVVEFKPDVTDMVDKPVDAIPGMTLPKPKKKKNKKKSKSKETVSDETTPLFEPLPPLPPLEPLPPLPPLEEKPEDDEWTVVSHKKKPKKKPVGFRPANLKKSELTGAVIHHTIETSEPVEGVKVYQSLKKTTYPERDGYTLRRRKAPLDTASRVGKVYNMLHVAFAPAMCTYRFMSDPGETYDMLPRLAPKVGSHTLHRPVCMGSLPLWILMHHLKMDVNWMPSDVDLFYCTSDTQDRHTNTYIKMCEEKGVKVQMTRFCKDVWPEGRESRCSRDYDKPYYKDQEAMLELLRMSCDIDVSSVMIVCSSIKPEHVVKVLYEVDDVPVYLVAKPSVVDNVKSGHAVGYGYKSKKIPEGKDYYCDQHYEIAFNIVGGPLTHNTDDKNIRLCRVSIKTMDALNRKLLNRMKKYSERGFIVVPDKEHFVNPIIMLSYHGLNEIIGFHVTN